MRGKLLLLTAMLVLAGGAVAEEPADRQPVLRGELGIHDPSVIETPGGWAAFATGQEGGAGHGAIRLKTSPDGISWTDAGTLGQNLPNWVHETLGFQPRNIWAPSISRHGDTFYLYYSVSSFGINTSAIGLMTNTTFDAARPGEGWTDEGMVVRSERHDNFNAIDPWRIDTDDGRAWLAFGSYWDGIRMLELDPKTGQALAANGALHALASRQGAGIEAGSIIEHDGMFYLFVSFDQCCKGLSSTYRIMVGRADNVTGPYLDRGGRQMLRGGGSEVQSGEGRFIGPGGQEALHTSRGDMLAYHYYDGEVGGAPKLQISPILWGADGWPSLPPLPE